jgi:hypothetical protein
MFIPSSNPMLLWVDRKVISLRASRRISPIGMSLSYRISRNYSENLAKGNNFLEFSKKVIKSFVNSKNCCTFAP